MYGQNSVLIAAVLLASMVLAIEVGYRFGRLVRGSATEPSKAHVNSIQASLLGVLALLLGFTFSLALQRFDSRSEAVVDETNAIGTTYLRSQLLPSSARNDAGSLLRRYIDLRVQAGAVTLARESERESLINESNEVLDRLWRLAMRAAQEDGSMVTSGLFIQSLNEMIDSYGRRDAELKRHVPEVVLFLLYAAFLMTGIVVGFAAGVADHRASFATYVLISLIVVLTFIIVDLDRPRRGLIRIDHSSLVDLKKAIDRAEGADGNGPAPDDLRPGVTGRR